MGSSGSNHNNEMLRTFFDTAPISIAVFKTLHDQNCAVADFEIMLLNPYAVRTTGLSSDDAVGKRCREVFPTAAANGIIGRLIETATTGIASDFEQWYEGDGMRNWFHIIAVKQGDLVIVTAADITAQKEAERELVAVQEELAQQAMERYWLLFNSIDEAFALCEIVTDGGDRPVDYRILEVNPAFEKLTGLTGQAVQRASVRQLLPAFEDRLLAMYGRGAPAGEGYRFEYRLDVRDQWFDVYAGSIGDKGSGKFALVFNDITARKRAEIALRDNQERQGYLLKLSDALRSLHDPVQVQAEAVRVLGMHLRANRAGYAEDRGDGVHLTITRNYTDGAQSLEGVYRYEDYGPELLHTLRAGRTVVRPDIARDPSLTAAERHAHAILGLGATANVPLVKGNQLVAILFVHQVEPRAWTDFEVALMQETAERTWSAVERARAEEALRRTNVELESRVQERTAELQELSQARRDLLQQLVTVQEDERRRIARDLHDSLGQFLSALNLRMWMVEQTMDMGAEVMEDMRQLHQLVAQIESELDRLTMELRPPALDDFGLTEAIRRYAEEWTRTTGIPVDVYASETESGRLAFAAVTAIYRIVQEALTNVLKHAQASAVSIVVEQSRTNLRLIVEDNGVGFDLEDARAVGGGRRLGLVGIRERAALADGWAEIETAPGAGTTLYVQIPVQKEEGV